jgi:hypothetical protein
MTPSNLGVIFQVAFLGHIRDDSGVAIVADLIGICESHQYAYSALIGEGAMLQSEPAAESLDVLRAQVNYLSSDVASSSSTQPVNESLIQKTAQIADMTLSHATLVPVLIGSSQQEFPS